MATSSARAEPMPSREANRMKAEERKHLHHNELRDWLGRQWQRSGEGIPSQVWTTLGLVALVALLVVGWWYYSSRSLQSRSSLWSALDAANSPGRMEELADDPKFRGTMPSRIAKFNEARVMLQQGLDQIGGA